MMLVINMIKFTKFNDALFEAKHKVCEYST
jgi:hypothetical protein